MFRFIFYCLILDCDVSGFRVLFKVRISSIGPGLYLACLGYCLVWFLFSAYYDVGPDHFHVSGLGLSQLVGN